MSWTNLKNAQPTLGLLLRFPFKSANRSRSDFSPAIYKQRWWDSRFYSICRTKVRPTFLASLRSGILIFVFALTACGEIELYQPNANRGKVLFNQTHIGKSLGCITCHTFSADIKTVGPSLFGIATRAVLAKPNMPAKAYLYESIINPDAHIVAGYEPNIMYTGYADELSEDELDDLISFLLTQ